MPRHCDIDCNSPYEYGGQYTQQSSDVVLSSSPSHLMKNKNLNIFTPVIFFINDDGVIGGEIGAMVQPCHPLAFFQVGWMCTFSTHRCPTEGGDEEAWVHVGSSLPSIAFFYCFVLSRRVLSQSRHPGPVDEWHQKSLVPAEVSQRVLLYFSLPLVVCFDLTELMCAVRRRILFHQENK